jgi:L-amino acid N-acyltransferase YncA
MLHIRSTELKDIPAITEIYNEAILNSTATFDTEIKTIEDRAEWFKNHGEKYPVISAEINSNVIGWASLTKWSDRCAYEKTAEVSVYIHKDYRGKGIGKKLLEQLIVQGERAGLHYMLARISEGNESSIHIHELFGFEHIGVMKEVGFKFGKFLNVHLMQKVFSLNTHGF